MHVMNHTVYIATVRLDAAASAVVAYSFNENFYIIQQLKLCIFVKNTTTLNQKLETRSFQIEIVI